ncbi:MAG TPA: HAD hydrolase-like protein, partial [Candidatus Gracilibacteria bacterium]
MKIPPHIKAILWDMDGVIIDSENYWHQKSHLFYEQFTPHMTVQDQHNITGKNNRDTFAYLKTHYPDDMMDCEYEDYLTRSSAFALGEVYPCCD